jgi:hypothetical protein
MAPLSNWLKEWVKSHEKMLPIVGAIILALTYGTKEIWQANLERQTRRIESLLSEERLMTNIDAGVDPAPFYVLVDIECDADYACRAAEWFRHRRVVYARMASFDKFVRLVGPPFSDVDYEYSRHVAIEQEAVQNLIKKNRSDGNLIPPTKAVIDRYASALQGLESAVNARELTLDLEGGDAIESIDRRLHLVTGLSAIFYFIGWLLSFLGLIYGPLGTAPRSH